jgi:hypothetical protein
MSIHGTYDGIELTGSSWSISAEGIITGVDTKFTQLQVGFLLFFNRDFGMTGGNPGATIEAKIIEINSDTQLKIEESKSPNNPSAGFAWTAYNYNGANFNMTDMHYRTVPKFVDENYLSQQNTTPEPSPATLAGIDATEMTNLASNPMIPKPAHTGWNLFKTKFRDGQIQYHAETLVAGGISGDVDMY